MEATLLPATMPATPPPLRGFQLTTRDVDRLVDLLFLRFATVRELCVLGVTKENGTRWQRRLTQLVGQGLLHRFKLPHSSYLPGKDFALYTLETGVATEVALLKKRRWQMTDADWQACLAASKDRREQLVDLLGSRGIDSERVRSILAKNQDIACKIVFGESSQVHHLALAATLVTVLVHGARRHSIPIDAWEPDGMADLSFAMTAKGKQVTIPCRPDALLVLDGHALAVEAETGQSSRAKVADKVQRYRDLMGTHGLAVVAEATHLPVIKSLRVVFYCATAKHAQMVAEEVRAVFPKGTGLFLIVDQSALHLEYATDIFDAGGIPDADDPTDKDKKWRLYPYLAALPFEAHFGKVIGSDTVTVDGVSRTIPTLGYTALLTVPAA